MKSPEPESDQLDLKDNAAAIRTARTFWWWVLGISALVSVLGNALHAWMRVENASSAAVPMLHPAVASALAAVVPIAVLVHTHGLALIVQVPLKRGKLAKAIVFLVILLLAIGGFYLSWDALRELALQAGFGPDEAQLFPLLLDGSIAGATAVLLALPPARKVVNEHAWAPAFAEADAASTPAPGEQIAPESTHTSGQTTSQPAVPAKAADAYTYMATTHARGGEAPTVSTVPPITHKEDIALAPSAGEVLAPSEPDTRAAAWTVVAERLCAGPVRHDPELVAKILHMAFDERLSHEAIAAQIGWNARAVRRLLDDAKPHRLVALAS